VYQKVIINVNKFQLILSIELNAVNQNYLQRIQNGHLHKYYLRVLAPNTTLALCALPIELWCHFKRLGKGYALAILQ